MKQTRAAGPQLKDEDAARIKGMLSRGDRQSDIAQYHSVNQARVIEIKKGWKFKNVPALPTEKLPPSGPYQVVTRIGHERGVIAERVVRELREQLRQIVARVERELDRLGEKEGVGADGA
jgi:hypothetical protein